MGGEFISLEFIAFCKANGISRQLIIAYTPQQNGVARHMNRTIMNTVRNMLSEKQVLKNFWPKVINWTSHVLNKVPTLAVKNMTSKEIQSDVKPNIDYFWVFGCIGHVLVSNNKRKKLDDNSFKCVLLGISKESKAYIFYDQVSEKIDFKKNECQNQGRSNKEARLNELKWGDNNEKGSKHNQSEGKVEDNMVVEKKGKVNTPSSKSSGEISQTSKESSLNSLEKRNRGVVVNIPYSSKEEMKVKF